MSYLVMALFVTTAFPMYRAWQANRHTSLRDTMTWSLVAWGGWGVAFANEMGMPWMSSSWLRFLALCLTSAAAMAVFGARRPGMAAWNFVVVGLLSVELMPLLENLVQTGPLPNRPAAMVLLIGTFALLVLNYLPTRFSIAAILLGVGAGMELWHLYEDASIAHLVLLGSIWCAWLRARTTADAWHDFRDRFGAMWGLRVREMFNASARHAQLPMRLTWWGMTGEEATEEQRAQADRILQALLQRFAGKE